MIVVVPEPATCELDVTSMRSTSTPPLDFQIDTYPVLDTTTFLKVIASLVLTATLVLPETGVKVATTGGERSPVVKDHIDEDRIPGNALPATSVIAPLPGTIT